MSESTAIPAPELRQIEQLLWDRVGTGWWQNGREALAGKRIRPTVFLSFAADAGIEEGAKLGIAAAIELAHLSQKVGYEGFLGASAQAAALAAYAVDCMATYQPVLCRALADAISGPLAADEDSTAHGKLMGMAVSCVEMTTGDAARSSRLNSLGCLIGEAMYQLDIAAGKYSRQDNSAIVKAKEFAEKAASMLQSEQHSVAISMLRNLVVTLSAKIDEVKRREAHS